jgi:FkbM family methyltransferase
MNPKSDLPDELYNQDTDLQIIELLSRQLLNQNFLDVGAEKGGFARALFRMGFTQGVLFEPLPSHLKHLNNLFTDSCATILPYAIDREDRIAVFNIACDAEGEELNYFHSLNRIADHEFFKHSRSIETQCRSLSSLLGTGEIDANVGVLKIDTEGNDLRVLQGLGDIRPEVVVCEFVPPVVYPDWQLSFAENLIPEAAKLGYTHLLAVQRTHGDEREIVRLEPKDFTDKDWGNLIFIRQDLWMSTERKLSAWISDHNDLLEVSPANPDPVADSRNGVPPPPAWQRKSWLQKLRLCMSKPHN